MKSGKAAGPSGIVVEMIKAAGDTGVTMIRDLATVIIRDGKVPTDWEESFIAGISLRFVVADKHCQETGQIYCFMVQPIGPIFKVAGTEGKAGGCFCQLPALNENTALSAFTRARVMLWIEATYYRGLKLTEQAMKILERIVDDLIRQVVSIDDSQFGFVPGRGTTDAIFVVRQQQEKYLAVNKRLYMAFVDLEKAFDHVPRKVIWWALRKLGVEEWIVRLVQGMYANARSRVRVGGGFSKEFEVKVGVHQQGFTGCNILRLIRINH